MVDANDAVTKLDEYLKDRPPKPYNKQLTEFKLVVQNRAHDKYLDSLKNMSSEEQKQALLKFKEDYKLVYSI